MHWRIGLACGALLAALPHRPARAVDFGMDLRRMLAAHAGAPAVDAPAPSPRPLRLLATGPDLAAFARRLDAEGLDVRLRHNVLRVVVPAAELSRLAGPERVRVHDVRKLRPSLDVSAPLVGVGKSLRGERGGRDVLVAILDTGTDFAHPDFRNPDGSTRFVAYLDQTAPDAESPGFVCDAVDINRALQGDEDACPNRADEPFEDFLAGGHGSHVAGIAAGNDAVYKGIAPEAMLVGVRMTFDEPGLVDALNWVAEVADRFGKPVVINLSLGANDGGHDGLAPSELTIDDISGPGRIVVAAAGNEGGSPIHVSAPAAADEGRARFRLGGLAAPKEFHAEVWTSSGDGFRVGLALEVEGESPGVILDETPLWTLDELADGVAAELADGDTTIANVLLQSQSDDGGNGVRIRWSSAGESLAAYGYQLRWISPNGDVDAWLTDRVATFDPTQGQIAVAYPGGATDVARFYPGDRDRTLTLPGSARESITVTGFVSRKEWPTVDGDIAQSTRAVALGSLLDIASLGPTRDGRVKPDIAAPGEYIVSTMATTLGVGAGSKLQQADMLHWVQRGTSMAAPHVAGLAALLLQENAALTPDDVKAFFAELAVVDGDTGSDVPNAAWGAGKVTIAGAESKTAWQAGSRRDATPPTIDNIDARRADNGIILSWTTDELASGTVEANGEIYSVASYALRQEFRLTGRIPDNAFVRARDPAGNENGPIEVFLPDGGCGCHAGQAPATPWGGLLLAALTWLAFRRRRA